MYEINVRPATIDDLNHVLLLVKELAAYEKAPEEVTAKLKDYQMEFNKDLFRALVAELGNEVVGIALFYPGFSTWKGKFMYLEDFYVQESHRGKKIGKALFEKLIETSKEEDCKMIRWQVLDWNEPALNFYAKYDAIIEKNWWNGKYYL